MKATLDQEGCIGCGLCANTCPAVFEMDDATGKAFIKTPVVSAEDEMEARSAADGCPVSVIAVTE